MFLTTDTLDPNRQSKIESFDKTLVAALPADYIHFLQAYGTGTYCDEVFISYPDSQHIPLTFGDYTDFWELDESYTVDDLLSSIQIGWTANGDIICVTEKKIGKLFVLPRHSAIVTSFNTFHDAINSFVAESTTRYFDPAFDRKQEQISLIKASGGLTDISILHEAFLQKFPYDFIAHQTTQPKYFFKRFGGWVSFDLIYKNSISIKFQNHFFNLALPVIDFLKQQVA